MIERTLIHVTGPAGAGKTAFVQALVGKIDQTTACIRVTWDENLDQPQESAPGRHPELRRYREAGAYSAALYRTPPGGDDIEVFLMTRVMQDVTSVVVLEGDRPHGYLDLTVFVAPPLAEGQSLLSKTGRGPTQAQKATVALLGNFAPSPIAGIHRVSPAQRGRARNWVIDDTYRGIERAHLVIVNVRGEKDRLGADRLLQEVTRLRKDPAVFADILGFLGHKTPITAVAADLANPADPGLKKAVARVKRAIGAAW